MSARLYEMTCGRRVHALGTLAWGEKLFVLGDGTRSYEEWLRAAFGIMNKVIAQWALPETPDGFKERP